MTTATATKAKKQSAWAKDENSARNIAATISPETQTAIDGIKASSMPKATKDSAIQALQATAAGGKVHLIRHESPTVQPLVSINGSKGIKLDHVKTILSNAKFFAGYIAEMESDD